MDLEYDGSEQQHKNRFQESRADCCCGAAVLSACAFVVVMTSAAMPELGFLAQCQNIPGGDICQITLQ